MVTDLPPRLVTLIILGLVLSCTLATAIPKLRSTYDRDGFYGEEQQDTSDTDQQPMVLKEKTADGGEEPVLIEFSYAGENKQEQPKSDDPSRYSYNIIDSPKANDRFPIHRVNDVSTAEEKLIPVDRGNDAAEIPMFIKDDEGQQNPAMESEESADDILQWNARSRIEVEENVPGSHNWPKHVPDHLRPISPFSDEDRTLLRGLSFLPGRQTKRDEAFVPRENVPPPDRAGPYLYPESIADREFRVPFY